MGTSLVAQWQRIHLPMQDTQNSSLVQEDPHMHNATQPHSPQLLSLCSGAQKPQLLSPHMIKPGLCNERSHHNEKSMHHS